MADDRIELELVIDDKGTATITNFAKKSDREIHKVSKSISEKIGGAFRKMGKVADGALKGITRNLFSLKGAIAGLGMGLLVKSAFDTASGFEKMQMSLDTITKGKGAETFKELNEWAIKMPVNTQKAIETFTMLSAMGLKPSIAQMTTLVDTMAALGGGSDVMQGIGRALGQIQAKGKVAAEEIMQLTERGVPASEILQEKLGLTAEQVAEIGKQGVSSGEVIKALWEGMNERFGGLSENMRTTWGSMVEELKSNWTEFVRLLMNSGPFEQFKTMLRAVLDQIKPEEMKEIALSAGKWIAETVESTVKGVISIIEKAHKALNALRFVLSEMVATVAKFVGDLLNKASKVGAIARMIPGVGTGLKIADALAPEKMASASNAANRFAADTENVSKKIASNYDAQFNTLDKVKKKMNDIVDATKAAASATGKVNKEAAIWFDKTSNMWTNRPKPVVEPQIKRSPPVPWSQGIKGMMDDMNSVATNVKPIFDAAGFSQLVQGASASARGMRDFGPGMGGGHGQVLWQAKATSGEKDAYRANKELYQLQMQALKQMLSGKAGGSGGARTYNINVAGGESGMTSQEAARDIMSQIQKLESRGAA